MIRRPQTQERDNGAACRTPETSQESMGRARRDPPLCPRRIRFDPARMDRYLLPLVGRLHAGRRSGRHWRKGRRRACSPRFMVRIRIPNGIMTSPQLRAISDLTRRHANGIADLTVRQNIQLHWVTIESLPEVLEGLWRVGLNTTGACGDVVRNVTGCPVAGVDAEEIVDASPLVLEMSQLLPATASSITCRGSSRSPLPDATPGALSRNQ